LKTYDYNPVEGQRILENLGWRDYDRNADTPREAIGVDRVPPRTKLIVNLISSSATQRKQVTEIIAEGLRNCQIGVNVANMPQADFYAQGPVGPVFGRQFDLAEFAMATTSVLPPCSLFASSEIPNASNNWLGTNLSGYKNPLFDLACKTAMGSMPDEASYLESYRQTQTIFAEDLPALPLYNRIEIAAARYDFCNFVIDPTTDTDLYAIATFDYGESCLAP
jgi:peptide/nickel transport system substrate-binding protein